MKKSAFTLIEMVISISIIMIIAALFIANYRSTSKRTDLIMAAQKLVADVHYAQNNALGLVKYNGEVPPGGWGVYFNRDQNSYIIFADLNAPGESGYMEYNPGEGDINYGARAIEFPPNIVIDSLKDSFDFQQNLNVTFLPPDPQTNIYNGTATSTGMLVQLKEGRNNSYKTVQVNFLGLAEVLD